MNSGCGANNMNDCWLQIAVGDLHKLLGGELRLGSMPPRDGELTPVGRIVADSRQVVSGDVFWGLRGERNDGAHYAEEAYTRGATGVVTSGRWVAPWAGRWSLEIADSHAALARLAAWHRERFKGKVIAIAGDVGKTTTQAMINAVLSMRCVGSAAAGSQADQANVAVDLLRLKRHDDYALVRISARASVEAQQQSTLIQPDVAVFTQIDETTDERSTASASLETARAVADSLATDAVLIANGDDLLLRRLIEGRRRRAVWFGRSLSCEVAATHIESRSGWLQFRVSGHSMQIPVWGRHHLVSALAAVAVGREFGLDWHAIAEGLAGFRPVRTHCEVMNANGVTIIDDTCNDSPSAMQAATALLAEMPAAGRRIVVCGDFEAEGDEGPKWRQEFGTAFVCRGGADLVVACGPHADDVAHAAQLAGLRAERTLAYRTAQQAATAFAR